MDSALFPHPLFSHSFTGSRYVSSLCLICCLPFERTDVRYSESVIMILLQLSPIFGGFSEHRNLPAQAQVVESSLLGYWGVWRRSWSRKPFWWEFFEGEWKWVSVVGRLWWVGFSAVWDSRCWNYSGNHWFLCQRRWGWPRLPIRGVSSIDQALNTLRQGKVGV
jgi:hypothetical protein